MTRRLPGAVLAQPLRAVCILGVAAIVLGVWADQGQRLPGFWSQVPELGTPWVLLGFAAGRLWRRRWIVALLAGMGAVVMALISYYLFVHVRYGTGLYNAMNGARGVSLLALAAGVGAASGTAGAFTGAALAMTRTAAWTLVVAVPAAEIWRVRRHGSAHDELVALLAAAAVCLLWWVKRHTALRWSWLLTGTLTWVGLGLVAMTALPALPL